MKNKCLVIVGPTGAGKSAIALDVCLRIKGEIINADSRQVYKEMVIGTDKPTEYAMNRVPHHMYSCTSISETYNIYQYNDIVRGTIEEACSRAVIPVVVGGSGQYVWSLVENWDIPGREADPLVRSELEARLREDSSGLTELAEELRAVDPNTWRNVDLKNPRRVVRALEKIYCEHKSKSGVNMGLPPLASAEYVVVGLTMDRRQLYERIDSRLEAMFANGWVAEVKEIIHLYGTGDLPALDSIGYKEIVAYLQRAVSWDECLSKIRARTHKLVRSQYNWFNPQDDRIDWYDLSAQGVDEIVDSIVARCDW